MTLEGVKLKTTLRLMLKQVGLNYVVKEGVVIVGDPESESFMQEAGMYGMSTPGVPGYGIVPEGGFPQLMMGGMGGMGVMGGAGGGFR